jgi:hypothetical protein
MRCRRGFTLIELLVVIAGWSGWQLSRPDRLRADRTAGRDRDRRCPRRAEGWPGSLRSPNCAARWNLISTCTSLSTTARPTSIRR